MTYPALFEQAHDLIQCLQYKLLGEKMQLVIVKFGCKLDSAHARLGPLLFS